MLMNREKHKNEILLPKNSSKTTVEVKGEQE